MACNDWKAALAARLYEDIDPAEDADLDAHLAACAACRLALDELRRVRSVLAEAAPAAPPAPGIVIVARPSRWRPALAFAAGLAAASLLGLGLATGYLMRAPGPSDQADLDAQEMIRREVDRRMATLRGTMPPAAGPSDVQPVAAPHPVTASDLERALAHLERRIDGSRADDLDYVLGEIRESERRTQSWIGDTRQALRYVALANDPGLSQR